MRRAQHGALLGHIRELRPRLTLSQKRLAEVSRSFAAPVSREFIASLETAGLPGTVRKFLTFAWLTGADVNLLTELSVIGSPDPAADSAAGMPAGEVIAKTREAVDGGREREGLALALDAVRRAGEEGRGLDESRLLVAAAIAAKGGGLWRLGRELAERVLCHPEASPSNAARAALVMAQCLSALDRDALALHVFSMIDREVLEEDRLLAAVYWHDRSAHLRAVGRASQALSAADTALRIYEEELDERALAAKLRSVRALVLLELGEQRQALSEADRAVTMIRSTDAAGSSARRTYINAGVVHLEAGHAWAARGCLTRARRLAEASGHELEVFESQLHLFELAKREGRAREAAQLERVLRMDAPRFHLNRALSRACARILGSDAREGRGGER
jgi:tetratricopeptide (TPR) repeat protein